LEWKCQLPTIQRKPRPNSQRKPPKAHPPASARIPSAIVDIVIAAVAGLSTWYLVRPQPLLFQNEVDATPLHNLSFCERQQASLSAITNGSSIQATALPWRMNSPSEQSLEGSSPSPSSVQLAATSTKSPMEDVGVRPEAPLAR
jgi:HlyD family secretion protein